MKQKIIEVKDLSVSFNTPSGELQAIRKISFDLYKKEVLAIVGESGSGKSATSKAILGILAKNGNIKNGSIWFQENDLTKLKEKDYSKIRGSKISMVFQDPLSSLNPIVKIGKQITEGIIINNKQEIVTAKKRINEKLKYDVNRKDNVKKIRKIIKDLREYNCFYYYIKKLLSLFKYNMIREDEFLIKAKKNNKYINIENVNDINEIISNLTAFLNSDYHNYINTNEFFELKKDINLIGFKINKQIAKEKAISLMEEVGINNARIRFNQYPFMFSGGMRQRIVIAIALSLDPEVLICDEPTTALDATIEAQILDLIKKIKEDRDLSVIFITHDLSVVSKIADRVIVMYAGEIVEYGTVKEIFENSKHPYTWALLNLAFNMKKGKKLETIPGMLPNLYNPPNIDMFAYRNKYALNIDFKYKPPFFKVSDTHYARTWLLHPNAHKILTEIKGNNDG